MVTVLLLRIHQSGCVHEISPAGLELVKAGIAVYKDIRADIPRGIPFWPLGLPRFGDGWAAFGLDCGVNGYLAVWRFEGERRSPKITLPTGTKKHTFKCIYPAARFPKYSWSRDKLVITLPRVHSARVFAFQKRQDVRRR